LLSHRHSAIFCSYMPAPSLRELDPTAREKIGQFTLGGLLKQTPLDEKNRASIPVVDAIQLQLKLETGMRLPDNLVRMLGLSSLNWTDLRVDDHTLPLFYIGNEGWDFSLNDALATIEIANRSYPTKISRGKVVEETREPLFVRVAGVDRDTNRIVAVTYDAQNGKLLKVNVSLSDNELRDDESLTETEKIKAAELAVNLPTNPEEPYSTAGLVTQAMIARTQGHNKALIIQERPNGVHFGKLSPHWQEELAGEKYRRILDQDNLAYQLGYSAEFYGDGNVTISYNPKQNAGCEPWEISIPSRLQSTVSVT